MQEDNNIDDFVDDFEFKAITEGLGFHHGVNSEEKIGSSLKQRSLDLEKDLAQRSKRLQDQKANFSTTNMGDLAPFYQDQVISDENIELNIDIKNESIEDTEILSLEEKVGLEQRFTAYIIDLLFVSLLLLTYISGIVFASGLSIEELLEMKNFYFLENILVSFCLFYTFYFTLLDKTENSSVGKKMLKLRLVGTEGSRLTIISSFIRSIMSLFSLCTFGLLSLVSIPDIFSNTKIIKT